MRAGTASQAAEGFHPPTPAAVQSRPSTRSSPSGPSAARCSRGRSFEHDVTMRPTYLDPGGGRQFNEVSTESHAV